jgi:hypothetical protein
MLPVAIFEWRGRPQRLTGVSDRDAEGDASISMFVQPGEGALRLGGADRLLASGRRVSVAETGTQPRVEQGLHLSASAKSRMACAQLCAWRGRL